MNKEAYEIIEEIEQDGSHGASHLALRALDALSAKVNLRSLLGKEVTVESGFEKIHPLFIKAIVTEYGIERPETVLSRINAEEYRDFISS